MTEISIQRHNNIIIVFNVCVLRYIKMNFRLLSSRRRYVHACISSVCDTLLARTIYYAIKHSNNYRVLA